MNIDIININNSFKIVNINIAIIIFLNIFRYFNIS